MIRIAIADDHPVVRKGLAQFFREEPDFEVVAECANGDSVLAAIDEHHPDVVLLDLRMPGKSGIDVLKTLSERESAPAAILLVGNISDDEVIEAMRYGVKGIVLKEMASSLLVQAVRKVAAGGVWVEKDAVARAMERLLRNQAKVQRAQKLLTPRELEIVKMVAAGSSNREIAESLFISEGTVKTHLHTIFEKAEVKNRMQLVTFARESGFI